MGDKKVKIVAQIDGDAEGAKGAIKDVEEQTRASGKIMEGIWQGVGQQITRSLVDIGMWAVGKMEDGLGYLWGKFKEGIGDAAAFEDAMAHVATKGVEDLGALAEGIKGVSNDIGKDLIEETKAAGEALRMGVGEENIISFMKTASELSEVAVIGLKQSVVGLTGTLNAYHLGTDKAREVADKFVTSQRLGKLEIDELSAALERQAPLAYQLGVSLDELIAIYTTGTDQGMRLRTVFSGLQDILVQLLKPSDATKAVFESLGLTIDGVGKLVREGGLVQFLKQLSPEQLNQIMTGVDGLNLSLALMGEEGGAEFQKAVTEIAGSAGALETAMALVDDTLITQTKTFGTRFKNMWETFLEPVETLLKNLMTSINENLSVNFEEIGENLRAMMSKWLTTGEMTSEQKGVIQGLAQAAGLTFEEWMVKHPKGVTIGELTPEQRILIQDMAQAAGLTFEKYMNAHPLSVSMSITETLLASVTDLAKSISSQLTRDLDLYLKGELSFGDMVGGWIDDGWIKLKPYLDKLTKWLSKAATEMFAVISPIAVNLAGKMGAEAATAFAKNFLPAIAQMVLGKESYLDLQAAWGAISGENERLYYENPQNNTDAGSASQFDQAIEDWASAAGLGLWQSGGLVPGYGGGDIVPAMLEPGEMVVPKEIVSKLTIDNGQLTIPRFAEGGIVSGIQSASGGLRIGEAGTGGNTFNYKFEINGAQDPKAVAREIQAILRSEERMGRGLNRGAPEFAI